jgi:hypothetical protein
MLNKIGCKVNLLSIQKCLYWTAKIAEKVLELNGTFEHKNFTAKKEQNIRKVPTLYHGTRIIKEDHTYFAIEFLFVTPHPLG